MLLILKLEINEILIEISNVEEIKGNKRGSLKKNIFITNKMQGLNCNMRYIQKLVLENFQSHKHSEIEFDPYLNVIVGPSDQGKSAIIRALKWVLFNEPAGDFFIRKGESKCSVTVIFNDGTKLIRFRSKAKNTYHVYDKSGKPMVFEGFGTSVPWKRILH